MKCICGKYHLGDINLGKQVMLSEQLTYHDVSDIKLPEDIIKVFRARAIFKKANKGQSLITQSDPLNHVLYLDTGIVEISILSPNSKKYVFRELGAGNIIGELSAIDGGSRSATVTAAVDSTYYKLSQSAFLELLENNQSFRNWLTKSLVKRIRDVSEQVFELSSLNVRSRILLDLIRRAKKVETQNDMVEIEKPKDQIKIATSLATHREAISREYSTFIQQGLIVKKDDHYLVPSISKLENVLVAMIGL